MGVSEAEIRRYIVQNFIGEQPPGTCFAINLPLFTGKEKEKEKEREKKEKSYKVRHFLRVDFPIDLLFSIACRP